MPHPELAANFAQNVERVHRHDKALWSVRQKRDKASKNVPEWEILRSMAEEIKTHTMENLDTYLLQFEANAKAKGIQIHWAKNAEEHNKIILQILNLHQVEKVAKSKSMLTEECGLNFFLEKSGIKVVDTDVGERIVQFRNEPPSHILLPAIHLGKEDVGKTFEKYLDSEVGNNDPAYLTKVAKTDLRKKLLEAEAGITGVNFGICETGGIVLCTNEGNADLGVTLSKLHIASMGIEKLVPRLEDLAIFIRLLGRSATGQPITAYTSHYEKPKKGGEFHIVILDNSRSPILSSEKFSSSLNCIRCGACMNTCPVFRRSGGFSYENVVPGPLGSTLGPSRDLEAHKTLPYACTLCGSCSNICPVKIDLEQQLYFHRQDVVKAGLLDTKTKRILNLATWILARPYVLNVLGKIVRKIGPVLPRWALYMKKNIWGRDREMPEFPEKSFKELYKERIDS